MKANDNERFTISNESELVGLSLNLSLSKTCDRYLSERYSSFGVNLGPSKIKFVINLKIFNAN